MGDGGGGGEGEGDTSNALALLSSIRRLEHGLVILEQPFRDIVQRRGGVTIVGDEVRAAGLDAADSGGVVGWLKVVYQLIVEPVT